jgi:23S rRNA (cytosine1962-C5)-methyltransferase
VPVPAPAPTTLVLAKDLARRIRVGHPWIYRQALRLPLKPPPRGALVDVVAGGPGRDGFVARGFFDPDGPIAVRVLSIMPDTTVGPELVAARVARAASIRTAAAAAIDSDAVRLLHGEADRTPGLVLDRYRDLGAVRFDGAAARAFWQPHLATIAAACAAAGFPLRRIWGRGEGRGGPGAPLLGEERAPPAPIVIREGPAELEVDVVRGQKTGLFLDQRGNRRLVGALAASAEVLNLFAYTGGFSVAAALGGARRVTSVDLARPAIEAAARNLRRNGVPDFASELHVEDAFAFLARAAATGRRWDLVICDPPSFAPSARAVPGALLAYRRLNRAAAQVVAPGGLLATASCSSHVALDAFRDAVADAVAGRDARLLAVRGAGPDHPALPGFPEGQYLKFLLLALT